MKGEVEATYQRTIALAAANTTFNNIEMESAWTNGHSKMEPITMYTGEVWDLHKGQSKTNELNVIMDNIPKRIFKVPPVPSREALYIEPDLLDMATIIMKI